MTQKIIKLDKFVPRSYQEPIFDALENKGYKRVIAILPRRAGKDLACWNLLIRAALRKTGIYWMIYPTYSQGKKILWNGMTNDGLRFIDYIPRELIKSLNSQEMKITLINDSLIQVIGSDNPDALVGSNPCFCVFSEYALQDPRAYQLIRPILTANDGIAVFISTPRSKNHLFDLYNIALANPDEWFAYKMDVEQTGHIDLNEIKELERTGEMSWDMIQQEFYVSFDFGQEGTIYGKQLNSATLAGHIGDVPWDNSLLVNTAWDIGRDCTAIIFFQVTSTNTIRVIDYYEKKGEQLDYFVGYVKQKPYQYNKHFFPHDMGVIEWGGPKFTRMFKVKQLGLQPTMVDRVLLADGIEYVKTCFSRIYIDQSNCKALLKSLSNYRREFDSKKQVYKEEPLHDWASHGASAFMYMCLSLPKTKDALSGVDYDRIRREALYGPQSNLPHVFR